MGPLLSLALQIQVLGNSQLPQFLIPISIDIVICGKRYRYKLDRDRYIDDTEMCR